MSADTTVLQWPEFCATASDQALKQALKPSYEAFLHRRFGNLAIAQFAQAKRIFLAIFDHLEMDFFRKQAPKNEQTALACLSFEVFDWFANNPLDPLRGPDPRLLQDLGAKILVGWDGTPHPTARETVIDLFRQMKILGAKDREMLQVLQLRYLLDMTRAETCKALDLSLQSLRTLEARGLSALKAAL